VLAYVPKLWSGSVRSHAPRRVFEISLFLKQDPGSGPQRLDLPGYHVENERAGWAPAVLRNFGSDLWHYGVLAELGETSGQPPRFVTVRIGQGRGCRLITAESVVPALNQPFPLYVYKDSNRLVSQAELSGSEPKQCEWVGVTIRRTAEQSAVEHVRFEPAPLYQETFHSGSSGAVVASWRQPSLKRHFIFCTMEYADGSSETIKLGAEQSASHSLVLWSVP
jgi:hypothetical protein